MLMETLEKHKVSDMFLLCISKPPNEGNWRQKLINMNFVFKFLSSFFLNNTDTMLPPCIIYRSAGAFRETSFGFLSDFNISKPRKTLLNDCNELNHLTKTPNI